jgi:hypothetical protein
MAKAQPADVTSVGKTVEKIEVQLGTRFLEHFSEQLYSSPNKAFEELIANSWDAGANTVHVFVPEDLTEGDAAIFVLDNGVSMDKDGLHDLWKVAFSRKRDLPPPSGRPVIGKFGIGKLATYVLASKVTYVCKATDGVIRLVTMDYGKHLKTGDQSKLIKEVELDLREASWTDVQAVFAISDTGKQIRELIKKKVPAPKPEESWQDEYGGPKVPQPPVKDTWTLVVLTDLKPAGKEIKKGVVRRMIQTALPLGSELNIVLNGGLISSAKESVPVLREWVLGQEYKPDSVVVPPEPGVEGATDETVKISAGFEKGMPFLDIDGFGRVTGKLKIYEEKISGGKSEELGASNGFFVNVLGRVTNNDPAFGEKDLSHSVWARFRMTVRADELDKHLAVNREQFRDSKALRIFRAFLRKSFNSARSEYDAIIDALWSDTGKIVINAWGTLPIRQLKAVVPAALSGSGAVTDLISGEGLADLQKAVQEWQTEVQSDITAALKKINLEPMSPAATLARYRVRDRSVVVNSTHPFVQEHSSTVEERRTIKDFALVDFLTDLHAIELGLDPTVIEELRRHRDRMARLIAHLERKSGYHIAETLIKVATYRDYHALEILVSEALDYLGFGIERLGAPGEPEGIARAYPTPVADKETVKQQLYSFTYDAKSSQSGKVQTGNIHIAELKKHRIAKGADYTLVVAPEFETGDLATMCEQNGITPMRAKDLGILLQVTAKHGAIPLTKLRELFDFNNPADVSVWVAGVEAWLVSKQILDFPTFFKALNKVKKELPDLLSASLIADYCRDISGNQKITEQDVAAIARGLQVAVPDLVRVDGRDLFISVTADKIAATLATQLQKFATISVANADGVPKQNGVT